MGADWTTFTLGEILAPVRAPVQIADDVDYEQVTVAIKGRGLRIRRVAPGSEIKTKRQFRISQNQLLVSKIDARNGGIGIVPPELDGAIVSGDFPVFCIDGKRCLPAYLDMYVKRPIFWEECLLVSEGSTNRVRLVPGQFLDLEVELPPIVEQQAIVAAAETFMRAEKACREEASVAQTAHAAGRLALIENSDGELVALEQVVLDIEGGKSPKCLDRPPAKGEYGVLKVSAIRDGVFRPEEAKTLPSTVAPWSQAVRAGDLLYGRANTSVFVGTMCMAEKDQPTLLLCDKTMRVEVDRSRVSPRFLIEAIGTPSAREHIELMAGGTSDSMQNISQASYLETEIVLPPLPVQEKIVDRLHVFRQAAQSATAVADRLVRVRQALVEDLVIGVRSAPPRCVIR